MNGRILASRLRTLRKKADLTQRDVARLLRPESPLSVSLISSWEKDTGTARPGEEYLEQLARLYAGEWTAREEAPRVLTPADMRPTERERSASILVDLRAGHADEDGDDGGSGEDWPARFWRFDDDLRITIIASAFPAESLETNPYANPRHPNYMPLLAFSDGDAVMELYGHLKAENPGADIRYLRPSEVRADQKALTGHVIVLGGGDLNEFAGWFGERMNLPVAGVGEGEDEGLADGEPSTRAEFVVRERDLDSGEYVGEPEHFRPRFDGTVRTSVVEVDAQGGGLRRVPKVWPNLVYDIALVARQSNPQNLDATATLCYGLYSRGTYGAARIFTDPDLREANEEYRRERFGDTESYWMLVRVACSVGIATTPVLRRPYIRVQEWLDGPGTEEGASPPS